MKRIVEDPFVLERTCSAQGVPATIECRPYRPRPTYCALAQARVILFSSDLTWPYAPLVNYYGLRFQIEFNFRDAITVLQGLEDFAR